MIVQAVYFHIPFCEHICYYCDFNKVLLKGQPVDRYLDAMELEMTNTVKRYGERTMKTAFVGGGTPTALNLQQTETFLEAIERTFRFAQNYEFTFEANPGNLDREKLTLLKRGGVNRLSIGVQSFQTDLLQTIGRTHSPADAIDTVNLAHSVGFENISIDLMFGLPGQTTDMFIESLERALDLPITHLSAYSLQIEPQTIFYNLKNRGELQLPSDDTEADMYEYLIETMEKHGFYQYEISNFAKPGFESKHNLTYWNNEQYYGIGAGAHSYVNEVRYANIKPIKKYMSRVFEEGFPYIEENKLSKKEQMEEELIMGLRKMDGVSKSLFCKKYGDSLMNVFGSEVDLLLSKGLLQDNGEYLSLTKRGLFLGNEVFQSFLSV